MHAVARSDPTLTFAKSRKFHFSSATFVSCFFQLFVFTSISNITHVGRLCCEPTLLCAEWFWLFILSIYLIKFCFLCVITIKYKNKISINSQSLTCFFSEQKFFILWAEFVMGRECCGPSLLWAEMSRNPPKTPFFYLARQTVTRRFAPQTISPLVLSPLTLGLVVSL